MDDLGMSVSSPGLMQWRIERRTSCKLCFLILMDWKHFDYWSKDGT